VNEDDPDIFDDRDDLPDEDDLDEDPGTDAEPDPEALDGLARYFGEQAQIYDGWAAAASDPLWKAAYLKDAERMRALAAFNRGYAGALEKFDEAYPVERIPEDRRWYRVLIRVLELLGGMKYVDGYTLYKDRLKEHEASNERAAS
jgi:hypothetical protein